MKHMRTHSLASALAVLVATPLLGQEGGGGTLEGKRVQDAEAEYKGPTFVQASIGARATVHNATGERLGAVQDHIIDRVNGKIEFVVLETGQAQSKGPARLVPYDRFVWDAEKRALVLAMRAQDLELLRKYDEETLRWLERATATKEGGASEDGAGDGSDAARSAAAAEASPRYLTSSSVLGCEVVGTSAPVAGVGELVLEPTQGAIAFVLADAVKGEGDPLILPWQAMTWKAGEPQEDGARRSEGCMTVPFTAEALEDAPRLVGSSLDGLADTETLAGIYRFYELTPPPSQAKGRERRKG
jgi:hypothetical protein